MESGQTETTTGTVQMALTAVGTDGDTYRLRNAMLDIVGPTSASVSLDEAWADSPVFAARVDVGDYTVALEEGWTLQRHNGQTFETVEAQMLSPNPAAVGVERDATSVVTLQFETVDAEIEFATGDLEVHLNVSHLDCEHGETITRSCGANLTGRQFRTCDAGWWPEWSECSARCDRGFCLFKDTATFRAASVTKVVETVGFEKDADGSPVPADLFAAISGEDCSDDVTFVSVGASNQDFPHGSGTPFLGQVNENIVIYGGDDSGDASIRSSAGGHNFSGFDAIEAIFPTDTPVHAAVFTVDSNEAGYVAKVYGSEGNEVSSIVISSGDGTNFVIIHDPTHDQANTATSIRLTPSPSPQSIHGTHGWSMTEFAFAN